MVLREDYRHRRLDFLKSMIDVERSLGLEIGALDFPVLIPGTANCEFADYLSREHLCKKYHLPIDQVTPLDYVIDRKRLLQQQLHKRYDYLILCHVFEYVPDPIRYLKSLAAILNKEGIILLAMPDRRHTRDLENPCTTRENLLTRYRTHRMNPTLEELKMFARTWLDDKRVLSIYTPIEFDDWAREHMHQGEVEIHCTIWEDNQFRQVFNELIADGVFQGLQILKMINTTDGFIEFLIAFKKTMPRNKSS